MSSHLYFFLYFASTKWTWWVPFSPIGRIASWKYTEVYCVDQYTSQHLKVSIYLQFLQYISTISSQFHQIFSTSDLFLYRTLLVIQPARHVLFFPAFNLFNFQLGSSFLFIDLPFLLWTQSHRIKRLESFLIISESSGNLLNLQTIRVLARLWRPAIASHA